MKKASIIGGSIFATLFFLFYILVYPKFIIVSGYAAKNLCSCVFVAGIDEKTSINEDLNFNILSLASTDVDYSNKTVTASVFGLNSKTAYFDKHTGCSLVNKVNPDNIYTYSKDWKIPLYDSLANWYTYIDTVEYLSKTQIENLDEAMNTAFIEVDASTHKKNTRAALVLYKGQLVGEQYADGFSKNSRLMGWSMTKSLTATMLQMLAHDGKLDLNNTTKIESWQQDDRKNITWKQLLQMNSGLKWDENYADLSVAVKMLFNSDAIGAFATHSPLEHTPNSHWEYSSGTTNIIANAMHSYFDSTDDYIRYLYNNLFYKIGMYSMLIETDAQGVFVGSSYGWATARDWAKIGQLYLQKGNWAGKQLLEKDWVEFVQQPAPNSNNRFGGHFWLNKDGHLPDVPKDLYSLNGFQGQRVIIIPSKELVVVRLGLTYDRADFDFNEWLKGIIEAVE